MRPYALLEGACERGKHGKTLLLQASGASENEVGDALFRGQHQHGWQAARHQRPTTPHAARRRRCQEAVARAASGREEALLCPEGGREGGRRREGGREGGKEKGHGVRLWFAYGSPMVRLWFAYGLVRLWFAYGSPMVRLWFAYGSPMSCESKDRDWRYVRSAGLAPLSS
jgi:hypothetical protein